MDGPLDLTEKDLLQKEYNILVNDTSINFAYENREVT